MKWEQLQAALEVHDTLKEIDVVLSHFSMGGTKPTEDDFRMFVEFVQSSLPHSHSKGIVQTSFFSE